MAIWPSRLPRFMMTRSGDVQIADQWGSRLFGLIDKGGLNHDIRHFLSALDTLILPENCWFRVLRLIPFADLPNRAPA